MTVELAHPAKAARVTAQIPENSELDRRRIRCMELLLQFLGEESQRAVGERASTNWLRPRNLSGVARSRCPRTLAVPVGRRLPRMLKTGSHWQVRSSCSCLVIRPVSG